MSFFQGSSGEVIGLDAEIGKILSEIKILRSVFIHDPKSRLQYEKFQEYGVGTQSYLQEEKQPMTVMKHNSDGGFPSIQKCEYGIELY